MTLARRSVLSLSLVALTTPLVYPQSAQAAAKANRPPERTLAPGQRARCTASPLLRNLPIKKFSRPSLLLTRDTSLMSSSKLWRVLRWSMN